MKYSIRDLLDLIDRHDEHEDYYRNQLHKLRRWRNVKDWLVIIGTLLLLIAMVVALAWWVW